MPTWDDVRATGLALPGVEDGTSYGRPAVKVKDKGMCSLRTDPDALVLPVADMGEREAWRMRAPKRLVAQHDARP